MTRTYVRYYNSFYKAPTKEFDRHNSKAPCHFREVFCCFMMGGDGMGVKPESQSKKPVYIAIDLKSYYASVECVERGLNPPDRQSPRRGRNSVGQNHLPCRQSIPESDRRAQPPQALRGKASNPALRSAAPYQG